MMKKVKEYSSFLFAGVWIILFFGVIGCKENNPKAISGQKNTDQHEHHKMETQVPVAMEEKSLKKLEMDRQIKLKQTAEELLLRTYLQLSDALMRENQMDIKRAALLLEEVAKVHTNQFNLLPYAQSILVSEELSEQREKFYSISKILIDRMEKNGVLQGTLFVAECPMAFGDQGAQWLTVEEKILNPYFGSSMLTCGSIEKKIQATPLNGYIEQQ